MSSEPALRPRRRPSTHHPAPALGALAVLAAFGLAQTAAATPGSLATISIAASQGVQALVDDGEAAASAGPAGQARGRASAAGSPPTEAPAPAGAGPVPTAESEPVARPLRAAANEEQDRRSRPRGTMVAAVRGGASLPMRARPGGRTVARVQARTEFGSRTALSVAKERGHWLGVRSPDLPDERLGWVDARSDALSLDRTTYSITADLSRKRVELRRGDRLVKRLSVAIGRPESPTPTGRFAVTDKLAGGDYGSYYGCCILALSGHQSNPPPGWQGGNRLAIHGTNAPSTIGTAASAGCLRGSDSALQVLMRHVPVGTPVRIQK